MIRITRIVARLNVGGPAVHIINLIGALDPRRFHSELVVGQPGAHEGDMGYIAAERGIVPTVIPELGRELSPVRDLQTVVKLVRILRRQRPHIVETHTAKAGAVGRVAARLAGVPVVIHVYHGHVFYGYFGPAKTRLFLAIERRLARWTDRIVTISPAQQRDITQVYRVAPAGKVLMVPLGFDLGLFAAAGGCRPGQLRAAHGILADAPLVGFVGRLTGVKQPGLYLEAARMVAAREPETRFVFVGDGELRAELEQRAAAAGLADRVVFAGWQTEMPAVYAELDVLALTSANEGTPVTVIEALAAGVPVVATAVGGVPDVISDRETGLLVPRGRADLLAEGILEVVGDPERARGWARAGQKAVLERYSLHRLGEDMAAIYTDLLAEKGMAE